MMDLQPVALALAVSDDEEDRMAFLVDEDARNLLIVNLGLEPVRRRLDHPHARQGRPFAERVRDMASMSNTS